MSRPMSDERISFLINNLTESLEVEVKNWLGGLQDNNEKARLAKEIIALANHGGGYVFIGFDDEGDGHPEIEPAAGELEAFTQDNIASIVSRYVTPPCQCTVSFHSREGSELRHPVITVPGKHRTPVWAQRGSPDQSLRTDVMYIRRPGGSSEPARTQDDWEKVLERLVKARQTDQLNAIRDIINPPQEVVRAMPDLDTWDASSLDIWRSKTEPLQAGDTRSLEAGYWTVSFSIEPFERPGLRELKEVLEREMPAYSGWRPFTYIHRDPMRPSANGDVIEAWLVESHGPELVQVPRDHSDFWRVARDGKGFLLRPMQEDAPGYLSNVSPRPDGPYFDWIFPIYRMTEVLKFIEALGLRFSDEGAEFVLKLNYYGTNGRSLQQHSFRYNLWDGGVCRQDELSSEVSGSIAEISTALEEKVHALLTPIYEQFDFTELPKALVDNVVRRVLDYPN